jgi:hypothetical protein
LADLLAAIEASGLASHLRGSRWTYPLVNAGHVLGLALLVGAIAPLDLRLIGFWRTEPVARLAAILRPVAAFGAGLAIVTGGLLFSVQAADYAALGLFRAKLALVALGLLNAALHAGDRLAALSPARQRAVGALSLAFWIAALVAGRMLGYV